VSTSALNEPFFLGHPRGLFILFFTEMWERMSYYGMRALLVLYMTTYLFTHASVDILGFTEVAYALREPGTTIRIDALSSKIYGLYTGLAYFTPFFGGLLADRLLGRRNSILLGGSLMVIGHFLMASERLFFIALFVLVLGNGAFKPNISAQVGQLYPEGDPRRDGAFTLFYMGINLGAFIAPLICGTLGQQVGWHYGFAAAGVGMTLGLVLYSVAGKYLPEDVYGARRIAARKEDAAQKEEAARDDDRVRALSLVGVSLLSTFFWAAYEQQGNTLQLWADRRTDLNVLGFAVPSSWYQSFNPFLILLFAPLLDRLWVAQRARGREPTTISKMSIGCVLLACAYVVMMIAAVAVPQGMRGSMGWLASATILLTVGELYLSPVGLSLISRNAPVRMVATLMGVWFFSSFLGNVLGGYSLVPAVLLVLFRGPLGRGLTDRAGDAASSGA
jgi:POT family proton-dependent oligopeptide transporter